MEKLFNWTIGSFFRTIGRLIAYFAIGAFIAYILGHSNIDLGGITNLFYTKVNASEFQGIWPNNVQAKTGDSGTYTNKSMGDNDMYNHSFSNGQQNNARIYWKFDQVQLNTKAEYLYVAFALKKTLGYQTNCSMSGSDITCDDWQYTLQVGYWYNNDENQIGICNATQVVSNMIYYSCPIKSTNINGFRLGYVSNEVSTYTLSFSPFMTYTLANLQSGVQQIIDSIDDQTTQQQQQHNETMTIITDTNTTQEQNETTTFFEGFQFSSDSNGLVGVITAPLRVFTAISEGTFSDLCFTLKGKQTCFPNGNMIWQKTERTSSFFGSGSIATGIQAFVTLFNLVAGGYLLYKMGASVKRLTEELIDPRNTRIEVMKL